MLHYILFIYELYIYWTCFIVPLIAGTHRKDLMRMNNFVKVSQFDLTLKGGGLH